MLQRLFFPTRFGDFQIHAFVDKNRGEHLALVRCDKQRQKESGEIGIPVRIHSRCITGDALTSIRCDCLAQLEESMKYIQSKSCGMIIYLDQEGRGIGLANKIKAYNLQDQGLDTVEANIKLGFSEDSRDFEPAAEILKYFKISKIELLTNNPKKIEQLEKYGIKVVQRIAIITRQNKYNKKYMKTKKEKMNHLL
jgi:GTP cyclohydrolase II